MCLSFNLNAHFCTLPIFYGDERKTKGPIARAMQRKNTSCAVPTTAVNNRFSRFRRQHCRALDGGSGVGRRSPTFRRRRPSVVVPACTRPYVLSWTPFAGGRSRGICARAPYPPRHRHRDTAPPRHCAAAIWSAGLSPSPRSRFRHRLISPRRSR